MPALPYLVNCSILFTEVPVLERPAAARAAGFDAVEFWWPFEQSVPPKDDIDAFVDAIAGAGVQLVGLNFAAGNMAAGDRGLVSWPQRQDEFRANIKIAIDIGQRLGVRVFNALYGNRIEDVDPDQQDRIAADSLATAARAADTIGAVVLVEPVSGASRYPLLTSTDVLSVIYRVERTHGVSNLRLLADLYHLTVNGDDVESVLATHSDRIGHVQIADAPGRHEPGTGAIPIQRYLDVLAEAGYDGWVALEYNPSTTTQASLEWLPTDHRSAGSRLVTGGSLPATPSLSDASPNRVESS